MRHIFTSEWGDDDAVSRVVRRFEFLGRLAGVSGFIPEFFLEIASNDLIYFSA